MAFWDSLISIAPSVIGAIVGGSSAERSNDAAAGDVRRGYEDADAIYQDAYDDVLGYDLGSLETEGDIWDAQLGALAPFFGGQADTYATGARGAATRFGDVLTSADDRMRSDLLAGNDLYGEGLMQGAGAYQNEIDPAYASAIGRLDPYSDAGAEALGALRGVIARQPDELTPGQMRQREKTIRDMRANQAASGLRGSGRAGVAAFNEGLSDLDANFYDINQRRIDDATRTLNTTGYGATGAQAGMDTDRGAKIGASWRDAFNTAAAGTRDTVNTLGQNSFDTGRAIGEGNLRADDAVLQTDMRYGDKTADMVGGYYDDARRRAASEADARASSIMGKANSAAAAKAGPAFADARANLASGATRADTYGALGSFFSDALRGLARKDKSSPSFSF